MQRIAEFSIDGHDGSGKTPIAQGVKAALEEAGLRVSLANPFHLANAYAPGGEIYPLWGEDATALRAIELLTLAIGSARRLAQEECADVLLFDRHWMTVLVEVRGRPTEPLWTDFVPTFFTRAPPEKTAACARFSHDIPWTRSMAQVRDYHARYLAVAEAFPKHVVEAFDVEAARVPLGPIVMRISDAILSAVRRR